MQAHAVTTEGPCTKKPRYRAKNKDPAFEAYFQQLLDDEEREKPDVEQKLQAFLSTWDRTPTLLADVLQERWPTQREDTRRVCKIVRQFLNKNHPAVEIKQKSVPKTRQLRLHIMTKAKISGTSLIVHRAKLQLHSNCDRNNKKRRKLYCKARTNRYEYALHFFDLTIVLQFFRNGRPCPRNRRLCPKS